MAELKIADRTVLQYVIKSDRKRERLLHEERILSAGLENDRNPTAIIQAHRRIYHERLERRTHEARQTQLRRSGARGADARKVLLKLEEELKESEMK